MKVTHAANGYLHLELDQLDCQHLILACQVARASPCIQAGQEPQYSHIETIGSLLILAAALLSTQVNMCSIDHQHHLQHLAQQPLDLSQVIQ